MNYNMDDYLSFAKKHDPLVTQVTGPFGRAELIKYDQNSVWVTTGVSGLCVVCQRQGGRALDKVMLMKDREVVSENEVPKEPDSVQAEENDLVILSRNSTGTVINGYRCEAKKAALQIVQTLKHPKETVGNGVQVSSPAEMSTPSRDVPPPVPTPGSSVGKSSGIPPAVPTPGSNVGRVPSVPPAVPTPGSTVGKVVTMVKSDIPPPVSTPGSVVGKVERRAPSVAKSGVPPPVPTPTGQGTFPTTPSSPSIFNTSSATAHQPPVQPPPNVFASPPAKKPQPPHSYQQQHQRSESQAELAAGLSISPPTYGPNGWQAGPDINQLRLAVIKAAMSDSTSVCTLQAMLSSWSSGHSA
eukprot:TRINITY_DN3145_c2_g2_i1.p1 TRINITY_DN3145_c2_g2~~TRINITY_DN3145_c2_g2_i1.p1  ORF type:complete len:377 (+),score=72.87 TRINITY_DN3145_c2_g2_i1:68-1132(+)